MNSEYQNHMLAEKADYVTRMKVNRRQERK